jgi:trans-2,3-dihydro-3-hydroxyanthranilate isomerase
VGPLALHLSRQRRLGVDRVLTIEQGAEIGRPSTLYARALAENSVEVGGSACIVARGQFSI